MKNRKRVPRNTRKTKGGFRPFIYLLITIVLIGLVLFLLERIKKPAPEKPGEKPPVAAKKPAPPPGEKPKQAGAPEKTAPPGIPSKPEKAEEMVPEKKPPPPVHKRYSAPAVAVPPVTPPKVLGTGTVAILIDDMGTSVREAQELMAIGVPLTFSVIPGLKEAREVAATANRKGYEVMLHIPMEPQDYPRRRLEGNGLLLSHDDDEIEKRMAGYLQVVPNAVGANNHMGSRYTEDRDRMRRVLGILKENGMFFVDSMTTPKSVGLTVSREMGVHAAARSAPFLDNSQDVAAIKTQLETLAKLAVKRGSAIGICHPHKATIRALQEELPVLKSRGIRFVYVSRLVR
ncbi:MAG TPA: divergent polysaccharide deacetylase family protein [Geobacteraceae bacterium]|nr:divergent polysaccharide deacetylase family protein [Geobacteraceae bacterium]